MPKAKQTHSQMLSTRRRNQRRLKLLASAAKRDKKARNQAAKAAKPG